MTTLSKAVRERIEREAANYAVESQHWSTKEGYTAGATVWAKRAAAMLAFIEKWKDFNIEGDSDEQDQYDSELAEILRAYRAGQQEGKDE